MNRTDHRTVTQDGRDPWAVAREATARADALLVELANAREIAQWATRELERLREEHQLQQWAAQVLGPQGGQE
jgi:hypothetical protein